MSFFKKRIYSSQFCLISLIGDNGSLYATHHPSLVVSYFLGAVSDCPIRCIPCKGSRYPPTLPRPAVAILSFKLPLCQTTTEKGQMEVNGCNAAVGCDP